MLNFKNCLPFLLLYSLFYFELVSANAGLSDEQMTLLETLPPDQRDGIMAKMQTAQSLEEELEEAFEVENSLTMKPELEELDEEEICEECIFGYDFFKFSPTTFAPISNSPISSNYILGPGDKLSINFYGNDDTETEAFISREGFIVIPEIGPLNMTGLTFQEAVDFIKKQVELKLIGTDVTVSLSELRSISIYILGQSYKPGKYTLSGLSSVTNALFISGGVNQYGSLRNIKIKRENKVIKNFDFYDFLLNGSVSSEISLQDGDVIFIPFFENIVRVGGAFKRPHIYEFREGETIEDAVNFAGGVTSKVQPQAKIELNSIDNNLFERKISYLPLNSNLSKKLQNEDVVSISSTSSVEAQVITLEGEVKFPGNYSILAGDTLLDIIDRAGGYTEESYTDGAVYIREEVKKQQKAGFERSADELEDVMISVISNFEGETITEFSLAPIGRLVNRLRKEEPMGRFVVDVDYLSLKTDPLKNFRVRGGDSLYIPKRPNTVSIVGEVYNTSSQSYNPNYGARDYINLAGGFKDVSDDGRVFIIGPNGKSSLVKRSFFAANNTILPGSTIVVPRNPRPLDGVALAELITPILADLATSAAAIAAISD